MVVQADGKERYFYYELKRLRVRTLFRQTDAPFFFYTSCASKSTSKSFSVKVRRKLLHTAFPEWEGHEQGGQFTVIKGLLVK